MSFNRRYYNYIIIQFVETFFWLNLFRSALGNLASFCIVLFQFTEILQIYNLSYNEDREILYSIVSKSKKGKYKK